MMYKDYTQKKIEIRKKEAKKRHTGGMNDTPF